MTGQGAVFDDGKAEDAFRTIGEVAKALSIRQHVLRYWEDQFPMLRPVKRGGGRRYYRPEDVKLLATIDRLVHHEGYTLRGARLALEGDGKAAAVPPSASAEPACIDLRPEVRTDVVAQLRMIRQGLVAALEA